MYSKKHRVIYRNKIHWTKKKKKRYHMLSRREENYLHIIYKKASL